MTVLIGGTFRLPPEAVERFRPHMETMLGKSRAEDGCLTYSYAFDVLEPGLVRVFEAWRDQAALDAHFATAHLAAWRAAGVEHGVSDRRLSIYEVAAERPL
ncbi:putative quinol monooxygenase [Phenylobacterium sp.]|uniref:putative quinol monooxygenase n=1 Tax=Phenylobacterium sp. TaxID=1871053 RepID=UPI002C7C5E6D|nr:putative quinol monooxygenase [Phenylobacterium sp.]HVI31848.1 putative quinol monooxygenase [Phenylobacterium sp.]